MPYDPSKPANNSPIVAAEMRNQLAGLNDLIDQRVIYSDLYDGINANSSGPIAGVVDELVLTVSNPPTQAELQAVVDKLNALITALKRT
jgi:hypothetical protein